MKSTDIPQQPCPQCGRVMELASSLTSDDAVPSCGDVTICIGCGAVMMFDFAMRVQVLSPDAIKDLPQGVRRVLVAAEANRVIVKALHGLKS